jgi:hypothetical protein
MEPRIYPPKDETPPSEIPALEAFLCLRSCDAGAERGELLHVRDQGACCACRVWLRYAEQVTRQPLRVCGLDAAERDLAYKIAYRAAEFVICERIVSRLIGWPPSEF